MTKKNKSSKAETSSNRREKTGFNGCINEYVERMKSLLFSEEIIMPVLQKQAKKSDKEFETVLNKYSVVKKEKDGSQTYTVPVEDVSKVDGAFLRLKQTRHVNQMIPRSFIVMLVSQYDHLIGQIVNCIYSLKPELLNSSDRTFTLKELTDLGSIAKAKNHLIEKEIECLLRKSHCEQFDWLEKKFDITLRKGLSIWPQFIELTERRNLFVHTNGIISTQYMANCKKHNVDGIDEVELGRELWVTKEYYNQSYMCLFEIGFGVSQILWRRVFTSDRDLVNADQNLQNVIINLLQSREFELAKRLSVFSCSTSTKHPNDASARIHLINNAIAHKFVGDDEGCEKILDSTDWSSSKIEFQLAIQVLRDNFTEAKKTMLKIGKNGGWINKKDYEEWPLFEEFRKTRQFKQAFKKIYGDSKVKIPSPEPIIQQDTRNEKKARS